MKKQLLTIGLTVLLAVPIAQGAFDGRIGLTYGSANQFPGGEFRINVISGLTGVVLDGNTLGGYGGFETFCIEYNENVTIGGSPTTYQYDANVDSVAIGGGLNVNGLAPGGSPDPISLGTAWLYSKFRAGTLGYANNATDAGLLQNAFWYLENEITLSVAAIASNPFLQALTTPFGTVDAARQNAVAGYLGVVALNLYNGTPQGANYTLADGTQVTLNQTMLAIVPEPTTVIAGALLLLPFAASTIRILRKKREA